MKFSNWRATSSTPTVELTTILSLPISIKNLIFNLLLLSALLLTNKKLSRHNRNCASSEKMAHLNPNAAQNNLPNGAPGEPLSPAALNVSLHPNLRLDPPSAADYPPIPAGVHPGEFISAAFDFISWFRARFTWRKIGIIVRYAPRNFQNRDDVSIQICTYFQL